MQFIFRAQHPSHCWNSVKLLPLKAPCSLTLNARRARVPSPRYLSSQHEAQYQHGNGSKSNGNALVESQRDHRNRLSAFWTPTGGIEVSEDAKEDSHSLLIRGGFLRQAHAGLFQLLPLGLRIQEKLEKLLDKHMAGLEASKISLSTLSSQDVWKRTGRMRDDGRGSPEIFQIKDRKEASYILSPTHEEEITSLVGNITKSYKELPLRLYQITRKYRDEARPRQGLLRTREFLMKDLYTFDVSPESALESYETVRKAYSAFFNEFKIPYLIAKAASGEMGGDLSHEFHFPSSKGEDSIVSCNDCDYVANEELAEMAMPSKFVSGPDAMFKDLEILLEFASSPHKLESPDGLYRQWFSYSTDGQTLVQAIYPTKKGLLTAGLEASEESQINPSAVQQVFPGLDLSVENPHGDPKRATRIYRLYDRSILPPSQLLPDAVEAATRWPADSTDAPEEDCGVVRKLTNPFVYNRTQYLPIFEAEPAPSHPRSLLKIANGNRCAKCENGQLRVQTAVELGHTFYLGTRYTKPLNVTVAVDPSQKGAPVADEIENQARPTRALIQMGCHGIGVSRLIAAVADALVDSRGLNWPRVMAPFEAVVVPAKAASVDAQTQVYDALASPQGAHQAAVDVILDDRLRDFGWKLTDADMIGYPVIVVIGRGWKVKKCEVQCRRLGVKQEVHVHELRGYVEGLLEKL